MGLLRETQYSIGLEQEISKIKLKIEDANCIDAGGQEVNCTSGFADNVSLAIQRSGSGQIIIGRENVTRTRNVTITNDVNTDVISVIDLSGSMKIKDVISCSEDGSACCSTNDCRRGSLYEGNVCQDTCGGTPQFDQNNRLYYIKRANINFIDNLFGAQRDDKLGLVGYKTVVNITIPLSNNKDFLTSTINNLAASGDTCICCGIEKAGEIIQQGSNNNKVIIVMSDGEANVKCDKQGTGNAKKDAIKAANESKRNIENLTIYTIGFGYSSSRATLTDIADPGKYSYADTSNLSEIYSKVAEEIKNETYTEIVEVIQDEEEWNKLIVRLYNDEGDSCSIEIPSAQVPFKPPRIGETINYKIPICIEDPTFLRIFFVLPDGKESLLTEQCLVPGAEQCE